MVDLKKDDEITAPLILSSVGIRDRAFILNGWFIFTVADNNTWVNLFKQCIYCRNVRKIYSRVRSSTLLIPSMVWTWLATRGIALIGRFPFCQSILKHSHSYCITFLQHQVLWRQNYLFILQHCIPIYQSWSIYWRSYGNITYLRVSE